MHELRCAFAVFAAVLLAYCGLPPASFAQGSLSVESGMVLGDIDLRAEASPKGKVTAKAKVCDAVSIEAASDGWVKVKLGSGQSGWLPASHVGINVNRDGRVCLEMGLKEGIDLGVLQSPVYSGTGDHYGPSIRFEADVRADVSAKAEVCPSVREPMILKPVAAKAKKGGIDPQAPSDFQRMIVAPGPLRARSNADGKVSGLLDAYCLDQSKREPRPRDRLEISTDAKVKAGFKVDPTDRLMRIVDASSDDPEQVQLCLWASLEPDAWQEHVLLLLSEDSELSASELWDDMAYPTMSERECGVELIGRSGLDHRALSRFVECIWSERPLEECVDPDKISAGAALAALVLRLERADRSAATPSPGTPAP